jgi:hypothetical protein
MLPLKAYALLAGIVLFSYALFAPREQAGACTCPGYASAELRLQLESVTENGVPIDDFAAYEGWELRVVYPSGVEAHPITNELPIYAAGYAPYEHYR